jgi:hypothetical protein
MNNIVKKNIDFYVVGGTMLPDAPSYIERKADKELYKRTLAGDFCYVLTPRQMGKSSLMACTAHRLKKQGIQTVIVDLTQIGSEKKFADQWYLCIADKIVEELSIEMDIGKWWEERKHLSALLRLTKFFRDVVLENVKEMVVIFVDEIDTTIALPFTDDFFAVIRACHNARATEPVYRRLSFVLLGVATPSELIKDTRRTPFNIGHRIELTDFTLEEALPLVRGLGNNQIKSEATLKRILYWTGGHPYLTQKLCRLMVDKKLEVYSEEYIDAIVEKHFLEHDASLQDGNLNFVRDRLVHEKNPVRRILKLYQRILQGYPIIDDPLSMIHTILKLSGLVVLRENRQLSVRNRIYEQNFTMDWVREVIPIDWKRNITFGAIAVILIVLAITIEVIVPQIYIETIRSAQDDVPILQYNKLKKIPFYKGIADNLFAECWDRRALRAQEEKKWDEVVLYRLQALKVKDTGIRRREVTSCTKGDYENLICTYRHRCKVYDIAISHDGRTVLTGSIDNMARLWKTDTGEPLGKPLKHGSSVLSIAISPDGKTVLTGSFDNVARLWRTDTGEPVGKPMTHESSVIAVSFSPDGRTVLTGSYDKTARLWRADTGEPVGKPMMHKSSVFAVSFSPDGRKILTASDDNTVRLWRADTGETVGKPMKHESSVFAVSFSPDGSTVLTGSNDRKVRLWQSNTGELLGTPILYNERILDIVFSPDGRNFIAVTEYYLLQMTLSREIITVKVSRLLHDKWVGAYHFLDDKGDKMQVAVESTDHAIKLYNVRFNIADPLPIKWDPDKLLEEWQKKLALTLNEESGKIEPMYPIKNQPLCNQNKNLNNWSQRKNPNIM